ncbi:MAG TPA: HD domain-containing phosphohydrolase [Pirellulales bacterium]|jgi:putative two-component system response regulator|nr:HD domain-containing phosphohydrolase [Pirellulales bacterium]
MRDELTPSASTPPRLLIVDDEPVVCKVLSRWLSAEGYTCRVAHDAKSAWQILQQEPFDLVTLDVHMPGASGLDLLVQIKEAFPEIGVLTLTACGETATAVRALTQGAFAYLLKPVQREELLFHVRQGLQCIVLRRDRRRHTEELERRVLEQTRVIRLAHEETVHRLVTASRFRDAETGAHIGRAGLMSEVLARAAGWSNADCDRIRLAAPMRDIGKIGIPDAILRKPAPLTPEEFEVMKRHTTIGARMLEGSSSPMLQLACEIAQNHHERWDGTGYPRGLKGTAIPESARIVAIIDVYDALTHDRVYRPALAEGEVFEILGRGNGSHFEPSLLALFFAHLEQIRYLAEANPDQPLDEPRPSLFSAAAASDEPPMRLASSPVASKGDFS